AARNLGTASVDNDGALHIASYTDWTLSNRVDGGGALIKDGSGLLNMGDAVLHAGRTDINAGGVLVGDESNANRRLGAPGADEVTVAAGALLAGSGTVSGHVTNQGEVAALNAVAGHAHAANGTFTLAAGLTNAGHINLAGPSGTQPGNTLVVQGDYVGNGGTLTLRTVMGDDSSATDKLVIEGGTASGTTGVVVKTAGGTGALTTQGIRVVETRDGATTDASAFHLDPSSDGYRHVAGTLAAGAYDYRLARGGDGGVVDDWYLVSRKTGVDPVEVPDDPADPGTTDLPYRAEVGAYFNNRAAALAMPVHTLHERQAQAPGMIGKNLAESTDASAWVRVQGANGHRDANDLRMRDETKLIHFGSDIYRTEDDEHQDSLRIGVMGLWGDSVNRADNGWTKADGSVSGYNLGVYATWFGNRDIVTGPYVDGWLMYGSYDNRVEGEGLPRESYRSNTWTGSLEAGYAFKIRDAEKWLAYLEPQGQVIVQNYRMKPHTEATGTVVSGLSDTGVTTRLGVRLHGQRKGDESMVRPFAELNWWHGPASQSAMFNADSVRDALPGNRYEAKAGVQGNVSKHMIVWGSVAGEIGSQNYRSVEFQLGTKYSW
ncbi:autotransporter outer membrane beta-barrel domain-containing protein, partial [Uliginosibacterium sp. sgz301328]|uniref:autotransporter family protein n=1 Tax=Uliginosibacterium sp. sgz301328 TaxID=3243764 RepID=UPI00359EB778